MSITGPTIGLQTTHPLERTPTDPPREPSSGPPKDWTPARIAHAEAQEAARRRWAGRPTRSLSRSAFRIALAAMSFAVYVCTVFSLPQIRDQSFAVERAALAAAISNVLYQTPLGTAYSGITQGLLNDDGVNEPLWQRLKELPSRNKLGIVAEPPYDGNGILYVLAAKLAFNLFGLHAWSLPLLTLALMGLSAAMLLWWSRGTLAGVVVLYFSVLTVMLFTGLVWNRDLASQISVGGIRYFSLVGILPGFHLLLDLLEPQPDNRARAICNNCLIAAQTIILTCVVLVRPSALSLSAVIWLMWAWVTWRSRKDGASLGALLRKGGLFALVGVGVVSAALLSAPDYSRTGRYAPVFWHRAVISFEFNPHWPFDLPETYDCRRVRGGLKSVHGDQIGHCIWLSYTEKNHISDAEMLADLYRPRYEQVMRRAFFDIIQRYPGEALRTFFYDKPKMIVWSFGLMLQTDPDWRSVADRAPLAVGLLIAGLGILLISLMGSAAVPAPLSGRIAFATLGFATGTIPFYLAAWATPHTMADLSFYCLFGAGLALGALWRRSRRLRLIRRNRPRSLA